MSRSEVKKAAVKQLKKLNPESEIVLDKYGFIRIKRNGEPGDFQLPDDWISEEGTYCYRNSITLRHVYTINDTFVATLIVYQNA